MNPVASYRWPLESRQDYECRLAKQRLTEAITSLSKTPRKFAEFAAAMGRVKDSLADFKCAVVARQMKGVKFY